MSIDVEKSWDKFGYIEEICLFGKGKEEGNLGQGDIRGSSV